jgi:predicted tellurium resistance membrane protein TerC
MFKLFIIFTCISLLIFTLTWLIDHFTKIKWIKYCVTIILGILGTTAILYSYISPNRLPELNFFVGAISCYVGAFTALITAIILDNINIKKPKKA